MAKKTRRSKGKPLVSGSELLAQQLDLLPQTVIPEYEFAHGERNWRADFAIPSLLLLLEYEGLPTAFTRSRHTTRTGYVNDIEKYNFATCRGWSILRYHWDSISTNQVQQDVESVINARGGCPTSVCALCSTVFYWNLSQPYKLYDGKRVCLECTWRGWQGAKQEPELRKLFSARSPKRLKELSKASRVLGNAVLDFVFSSVPERWEQKLAVVQTVVGDSWERFPSSQEKLKQVIKAWEEENTI